MRPHFEYHQNRFARGLSDLLAHDVTWLDLGAGSQLHGGWLGEAQADHARRARLLVGCDLEVEHLRRNPYLTARAGASAYALPFRSGAFGMVTANMVLEHLRAPREAFAEVHRVLQPGGRFVFVTPNSRNPYVLAASVLLPRRLRSALAHASDGRDEEDIFPTFYLANTETRLLQLAATTGFEVECLEAFHSLPFSRGHLTRRLELLITGALHHLARGRLGSNLFGVLRRPRLPQAS